MYSNTHTHTYTYTCTNAGNSDQDVLLARIAARFGLPHASPLLLMHAQEGNTYSASRGRLLGCGGEGSGSNHAVTQLQLTRPLLIPPEVQQQQQQQEQQQVAQPAPASPNSPQQQEEQQVAQPVPVSPNSPQQQEEQEQLHNAHSQPLPLPPCFPPRPPHAPQLEPSLSPPCASSDPSSNSASHSPSHGGSLDPSPGSTSRADSHSVCPASASHSHLCDQEATPEPQAADEREDMAPAAGQEEGVVRTEEGPTLAAVHEEGLNTSAEFAEESCALAADEEKGGEMTEEGPPLVAEGSTLVLFPTSKPTEGGLSGERKGLHQS